MASQVNINIRTTKLNQPDKLTLTFNQRTLFDFTLTEDEMEELTGLNMKFAEKIFEEKN